MGTREIPREKWTEFFDGFSRRHEGWLVTVQVLGAAGAQVEVHDRPLAGIAADRDGTSTISIIIGGAPEDNMVHIIRNPSHVRVEESAGAERALQIQSEDGETTLVSFRSALPPEMVDGVLAEEPAKEGDTTKPTQRSSR
jgi:hypothetical protein